MQRCDVCDVRPAGPCPMRFNSNALLKKNCLELQGRFKTLKYMSQNSVLKGPHDGVNFGKLLGSPFPKLGQVNLLQEPIIIHGCNASIMAVCFFICVY